MYSSRYPYEVQRTPEALMQVRSFQNTYTNYIYESGFPQTLKMGNDRQHTPLEAIADNYPKFLLTMDYGSGENNGIKRLNVLDWLLGQNQQSANMSMEIKIKQDELKDVLSEIAKLYLENREAAIKKLRELLDQALANDLNKIEADDKSSQKEKDILRFLYIRYYLSLQNDLNNEEFFINVLKGLKYGFKIANELSKQSNLIK